MNKEQIIKSTEKFVKEKLSKEGTGHDWWHIERVRNNAKLICKSEKVDWFIVELAVLLHDIGDRKVINKDEDDHGISKDFLKNLKLSGEIIDKVMFIINNMSFSKSLNNKMSLAPMEFYVVQDADRLDAIGAIGIARVFAFGGSKLRPLYDPTKKAQKLESTENYRKLDSSSFHHFEEKILLLKNLMNTKSAKRIAQKRHKFVESYLDQFLSEWEGKR